MADRPDVFIPSSRRFIRRSLLLWALVAVSAVAAGTPAGAADGPAQPPSSLAPDEAERRVAVALRMLEGGVYDRARELAESVLDHPAASGREGEREERRRWRAIREAARFARERARLGLASTREELEDVADAFLSLVNNRYRLPEPAYALQSSYWAARAYEESGDYRSAVDQYSRVGGVSLPPGMEGDAAWRMSRCLRRMADELPYPGGLRDRRERDRLLNQAIAELDRARLAFPVGSRRKEIELDLIALRMARAEEQYVREAATEAETYIESDPSRDELHARAALFRGQAAARLGEPADAVRWFERVVADEAPSDEDRRMALLGMALSLMELSRTTPRADRREMLIRADEALGEATGGTMSPGPWDGARVIRARVQLALEQPTTALETLRPILEGGRVNPAAWMAAGEAELRRGRTGDALAYLTPPGRPSNPNPNLRYAACRDASATAEARGDFGAAIALNHQASRLLRRSGLFSTLLVMEFSAMENILKAGRAEGPLSLSGDAELLLGDLPAVMPENRRAGAAARLADALGEVLLGGGDPDSGYDLGLAAESAFWTGGGARDKLELAIAMIDHLRQRQPAGVTESALSSRMGEARHALALAMAEGILAADAPDDAAIGRTLAGFAAAAASFQEAAGEGLSLQDSLDQGMVNMESGAFLMRLADRWNRGRYASRALSWREDAKNRIEASLRPFNGAILTSGPSSLAARRARWSRGRALELLGEWRGAAADFLSLMNNSELPRVLRVNAARRWAACMGRLGESRAALARIAVFAENDAESALLAGGLAEEAELLREAYLYYLFAADPAAPALPPATPGRTAEAAYRAARLALADPAETNPLLPAAEVVLASRQILEEHAAADLAGPWAVRLLALLGESWLEEAEGWEEAYRLATRITENPAAPDPLRRAMHILAGRALEAGGNYAAALDELDAARELAGEDPASRADAAVVTLETARVYRSQGRLDDALRAYADVFATYPDQSGPESAARTESAVMLLSLPGAGPREWERVRGILSGLEDQMQAERIMREYGIR